MSDRKILVTGGSGFLGRRVIPRLLVDGRDVVALARSPESTNTVEAMGATAITGDLDDVTSTRAAFSASGAEILVNLASLGFGHAPTVVDAALGAGIRRAIFVSTTAIFTALPAPSKKVRLEAEETIRSSTLDWTIIRPTMIYGGPDDRNMARLLQLIRRSPVVPLPGGGDKLQQPVHVEDLARTIVAAVDHPASIGRAYDVAGPEPLTLRSVVTQASEALGRRPLAVPVPLGPLKWLVARYERLAADPRLKVEQLDRLEEDKAFDIQAAVEDLGHAPRPFSEGITSEVSAPR